MITCAQASELYSCPGLGPVLDQIKVAAENRQVNCVACVPTESASWIVYKLMGAPFNFNVNKEKEIGGYTVIVINGWAK